MTTKQLESKIELLSKEIAVKLDLGQTDSDYHKLIDHHAMLCRILSWRKAGSSKKYHTKG